MADYENKYPDKANLDTMLSKTKVYTDAELNKKQNTLVNQENIKSINGISLLGSGNLNTKELFQCVYGQTTFAEIVDALNASKLPVILLFDNNTFYCFNHYYSDFITFISGEGEAIVVNTTNQWVYFDSQRYEKVGYKTQYIDTSGYASEENYPSEKAVFDYVNPIKTDVDNISIDVNNLTTDVNNLTSDVTTLSNEIETKQDKNVILYNEVVSNWVSDNTYTGYDYKAEITVNGVTVSDIAFVSFSGTDLLSGNYLGLCETSTNTLTIYSKVNTSITIPNIVIVKNLRDLPQITNVSISGNDVTFDTIPDATSYEILIDGESIGEVQA